MLAYYFYKIGEFLASILPWGIAYAVGAFFANLQFWISKKDRNAVMGNLRSILPNEKDAVIREKARQVFVNFGLYLVEFFRFSEIDKGYVEKYISVPGKENLDNALKEGKGVILLTAHLGNWELGGMALALLGYPTMAIVLDHKNTRVNDFFRKRRESKGIEGIPLGMSIKQCYKGLKDNKLLAILGDRDFGNSSVSMDFLGKKKNIPRGPAVLAKRTGAPIIPVFVTRHNLNHLRMECLAPIEISKNTSEMEIIKKYTKLIEEQIYKQPSQWLMFREFWKE